MTPEWLLPQAITLFLHEEKIITSGKKTAGVDELLQYKKPVLHAAGVLSKKWSEKTNFIEHGAFLTKKLSNIISMGLGQFKILSHF